MPTTVDVALVGLGHVGRSLLQILEQKERVLQQQYGVHFRLVCVADSSGVAVAPSGFDPQRIRVHKAAGRALSALDEYRPQRAPLSVLSSLPYQLLFEASPVNLETGDPGLSLVRSALGRGIHTVLANKGPLVLAFHELQRLAAETGADLAYSATVCGGLPVINIGRRDLIVAEIRLLQGVFNSTSNYILGAMEAGSSYGQALAEAQRRGIAESDPSLDVEGWDTANKLVIIANSFLGIEVSLDDVAVSGITAIDAETLQHHRRCNEIVKLVACAQQTDGGYRLSVGPLVLPADAFLAGCSGWDMGIEIHTDIYATMYHKIREETPMPTAAAMVRDAVNLVKADMNM